MIEAHLWIPRRKRQKKKHLPRQRRECFGELIQVDGSHHRWFGENYPPCVLIVFVDDATGCLTSLYFAEGETLNAYFEALQEHLIKYGRPRALYSDRFSVFEAGKKKTNITQFQRALNTLDIELILANSPQAKGRVERANRTLQNRLIREMRLKNITTIEEANRFLPQFIKKYNARFNKKPISDVNAHRPLVKGCDLDRILCRYEERTLQADCIIQYNNKFYHIEKIKDERRAKGQKIEIRESKDGKIRMFLKGKEVNYTSLEMMQERKPVLSGKERLFWKPKRKSPPKSHPWKKYGYQIAWENQRKREIKEFEKRKVV